MRTAHREPKYSPVARRRWSLTPILWAVGAGMLVWTGAFATWHAVHLSSGAPDRSFAGSIAPTRERTTVALPAYTILDRVIVDDGDDVAAGQTLATLNTAAMKTRLTQVSTSLDHAQENIACLLHARRRVRSVDRQEAETPTPLDGPVDPTETETAMKEHLEVCRSALWEFSVTQDVLIQERTALIAERDAVKDYISIGLWIDPNTAAATLRRHVALKMLRTEIDKELVRNTQRIEQARRAFDADLEQMLEAQTDAVKALSTEELHLQDHIASPRIPAPSDGTIARVRPLATQSGMDEALEIIEVVPKGHARFQATFEVALQVANEIDRGQPVEMHALGAYLTPPLLTGRVSGMHTGSAGQILVTVTLDEESINLLADPDTGLALGGPETATLVKVRLAPEPLFDQLVRSLENAIGSPIRLAHG